MYSEQIFKIYQTDKDFPMGYVYLCFLSKDYSVVHKKKILRQFKFSSKLSCEGLNYIILESVRNVFLVNKLVNLSKKKKRAAKYSLRFAV